MSGFSRSFGGEWQRSKKVSLAGRSRTTDATREEVLERTRLEREARRQHRLETRSAIALQASWRSWRARRKLKVEARERWTGAYGASGNRASAADFAPASPYLRDLLCFADPTAAADVQLLAAACRLLLERHGGEVPNQRAALEALPGVGRKTANVILNTAFGEETIAVDTHIFRVANRIGLAPGKTVTEVENKLLKVVEKPFRRHAHHWLILHGRYACKARKPACPACIIRDLCEYKDKTHV